MQKSFFRTSFILPTLIFLSILSIAISLRTQSAFAVDTTKVDELKNQIDSHSNKIEQLNKEIETYKNQIDAVSQQAQTLQRDVKNLDLTEKSLTTTIKVTENKIDLAGLTIKQLSKQIAEREEEIDKSTETIKSTLRRLQQAGETPLVTTLLTHDSGTTIWSQMSQLDQLRDEISVKMAELQEYKRDLERKKAAQENQKNSLVSLRSNLSDQKLLVNKTKQTKASLLTVTKNQESNYKKELQARIALRDAFQNELNEYESKLKYELDPSKLPQAGSSPLSWPLSYVKITQYFGMTAFSKTLPQRYHGRGHSGIDMRAAMGTPILAPADGIVLGSGNTDAACPQASYGVWVAIDHQNGLATIYGHLSQYKVNAGDRVVRGQIIGYSGISGYATGPHLHFAVVARDGLRILKREPTRVCPRSFIFPAAGQPAYLNPLVYLPPEK